MLAAFLATLYANVSSTSASAHDFSTGLVPPLGARECGRASRLRVCSHLAAGQLAVGATSGAVQALAVQYGAGLTCFRLDALATADGALLATSPERLQVPFAIAYVVVSE